MAARKKIRSIFTDDLEHCFLTGRENPQIHHIFFGVPSYRKHSEEDGYLVPLDVELHEGRMGVHHNIDLDSELKRYCQEHFEKDHTRDEFIRRYGKSYL